MIRQSIQTDFYNEFCTIRHHAWPNAYFREYLSCVDNRLVKKVKNINFGPIIEQQSLLL